MFSHRNENSFIPEHRLVALSFLRKTEYLRMTYIIVSLHIRNFAEIAREILSFHENFQRNPDCRDYVLPVKKTDAEIDMQITMLQKVMEGLKNRHSELVRWLKNTSDQDVHLRLGPHPADALKEEVETLSTLIEKAERSELGKCIVCKDPVEDVLFEMDYTACVCISHLDREQQSKLESELELSAKVQRALLPQAPPTIAGWEVAAFSQPASIVGGDYFDFLKFGDQSQCIVIADVMGKGMPASMLMSNLQASLRIIAPESFSPGEVILRLNRLFHHNIRLTKFVSIFIGKLDTESGSLTYVNAGHHPPLLVTGENGATGRVELLKPTGPAIGLVEKPQYSEARTSIAAGGLLTLYTDGIVECRSGSGTEFGELALLEALRTSLKRSASETAQEIRSRLKAHCGDKPFDDDATLIVWKRS